MCFFVKALGDHVPEQLATEFIRSVVIVGGGTAGWMTAAALSELIGREHLEITLVESEQIGTVGVGEATLPHLRHFNSRLGINEHEFVRQTQASYKLGIEFVNWGQVGESYLHPFGDFSRPIGGIDFYHYWLRAQREGFEHNLFDFSLPVVAAKNNKFSYPSTNKASLQADFSYAFHIDANLYAAYLRQFAEARGVTRIEGKVLDIELNTSSGDIDALVLDGGWRYAADFFIDCSGFRSLLLGQALATPFIDWSRYLPCDRAVALPSKSHGPLLPYSRATAQQAGWQWRIPLRHRTGNGHVYCSSFCRDEAALDTLLNHIDGEPLAEPRLLKFTAGRRSQAWVKNCAAIGLASGFLEPLESTSIYLIQIAIMKLIEFFPKRQAPRQKARDAFNRHLSLEYQRIRDFLVLHYHITRRRDSEFWNYCRTMPIPDSLQEYIEAFREIAHVPRNINGLFLPPSWVAVLLGQGETPKNFQSLVNIHSRELLRDELQKIKHSIYQAAQSFPDHQSILDRHCAQSNQDNTAASEPWPPSAMSLYGVFS